MGRMRAITVWGLFSLLIFLVSGESLSYAQWTESGGNLTTNDNVGIGTTSPGYTLDIPTGSYGVTGRIGEVLLGSTTVSHPAGAGHVLITGPSGTYTFLGAQHNDNVMVLTGSGNVGIGTTNPTTLLHVAGNATIDGNIAAKYQDVAEWVQTPVPLKPGTVVVIDPLENNRVLPASQPYDTRIAGVVSSQPGIILGEAGEDKAKIAHSGRVKVKADAQFGPIAVGDLLVSSSTAGYAMRSAPVEVNGISLHRPGTIVGKALEPLKEGQGEILVLLTLQ